MNELIPMVTERDGVPLVVSFDGTKRGAVYIRNDRIERSF